jgi:hypothetical protein
MQVIEAQNERFDLDLDGVSVTPYNYTDTLGSQARDGSGVWR